MIILTQDKENLLLDYGNFFINARVASGGATKCDLCAAVYPEGYTVLGTYSKPRCKELLMDILNSIRDNRTVYLLPEV